VTSSTPEADDFDATEPADLDTDVDVADLATDPLEAVLAAEGDVAGLTDGLDDELDGGLDDDEVDEEDLDEEDLDEEDLDEEDLDDEDLDDELDEELQDDEEPADLDAGSDVPAVGEGATPSLALDPAFEEDDEDLAAVVVGDEDEDEDVDGLRDGEFVCRSCFLAKRDTQLADPERMLCRDCA
jgi:hypothetical protein